MGNNDRLQRKPHRTQMVKQESRKGNLGLRPHKREGGVFLGALFSLPCGRCLAQAVGALVWHPCASRGRCRGTGLSPCHQERKGGEETGPARGRGEVGGLPWEGLPRGTAGLSGQWERRQRELRSAVSGQRSAVSGQRSAVQRRCRQSRGGGGGGGGSTCLPTTRAVQRPAPPARAVRPTRRRNSAGSRGQSKSTTWPTWRHEGGGGGQKNPVGGVKKRGQKQKPPSEVSRGGSKSKSRRQGCNDSGNEKALSMPGLQERW